MEEYEDKEYWTQAYGGMEKYLNLPVHRVIVEFIGQHYDVIGKRVLDIGGGPGIHCKLLQELYFAQCINLDKSQYALSFLQHEVKSYLCNIEETMEVYSALGELKFDFIFSIQVLEHCAAKNLPNIVFALLDHLAYGGHCFISVASPDNTADKTHVSLFPLSWWYRQFVLVGFEHDYLREKVAERSSLPKQLQWQCLYLRRP